MNIRSAEGYVEKIGGSDERYLVISSIDANKEVSSVLDVLWKGIKSEINDLISDDDGKFGTDVTYMENSVIIGDKIMFSSDISLPYGSLLKFHALVIVIRCVIEKDGKFYPRIYLEEGLFDGYGL